MADAARLNDTHAGVCAHGLLCCSHKVKGTTIEASTNVFFNGRGALRKGDNVTHNCPHCGTGTVSEGSSSVFINGKPAARINDATKYPGGKGEVTSGSSNITIGG